MSDSLASIFSMDYSTERGSDLHYVHQELKASVPGVGQDVPAAVLAAVVRLSGGYKHVAQSSYVERSSDGSSYYVYWTDGKVIGEVTATSEDWLGREGPEGLKLTGRIIPVDRLSSVEFADTPEIGRDPFDHSVSFRDQLRLSFVDGSEIVVPRIRTSSAGQREGLDRFVSAALSAVRGDSEE